MSTPQLVVNPTSLRMTPHVGADGITLALANPSSDQSVLYKCKTTSPARYIVRNRQGVIAPNNKQTVLISLQRGVVITGEEQNDVFLVESRFLDAGEVEAPSRSSDVIADLMKAKGKAAIAKIQVPCELSLGATAAAGSPNQRRRGGDEVSNAPSTHTQPASVASTSAIRAASTAAAAPNGNAATDPSPAPRDPAAATPAGQPAPAAAAASATPTTTVRPAPKPARKSSSKLYIGAGLVVVAAAYFGGFIGGGSAPAPDAVPQQPKRTGGSNKA